MGTGYIYQGKISHHTRRHPEKISQSVKPDLIILPLTTDFLRILQL